MRAYPAKAKKQNPAPPRTPRTRAGHASPSTAGGDATGPALAGPVTHAIATNTARTASTIPTSAFDAAAVRCTPSTDSIVSASTAAAATRPACPGQRYRPAVRAIAAQDAVLPTTKPQPARNPGSGPRSSRP